MTGLLTRIRARRALLNAAAQADADAWLFPILTDPAPALAPRAPRAGAHPYQPKGTRTGELTAPEARPA
ncbi:hypothetical protein AB0F17_58580 [Nonomuraea sp. NPDC026600]|uniref:hypothetical protein n=1 Tax=Nonomuraea sp. NPDC026600 TaxID=3155363 RepID=UPI0033C641DE